MIFSGCRKGPSGADICLLGPGEELREASHQLGSFSVRCDRDLAEIAVFDAGEPSEKAALEAPGRLAVVSTEALEPTRVLNRYPDLQVLCLAGGLEQALRYGKALGRGKVAGIGARAYSKEQRDTMREHQRLLPLYEVGLDVAIPSALVETEQAPLWLSINLDILAPHLVPGVTPIAPGGASFESLRIALDTVPGERLVGFEITGYPVPENRNRFTALTAAELMRDNILVWWGNHR